MTTNSTAGRLVITEENLPAILAFITENRLDKAGLPLEPGCEIKKFATEGIELENNGKLEYLTPFFKSHNQQADFFRRFKP